MLIKQKFSRLSGYLFLAPYLVLFAAFLVLPLCFGLIISFIRWEMLSPIPPRFIGLGNYQEAFATAYFWQALWATLKFVIIIVPMSVGGALLVALGINAVPIKSQAFFRASYFLPTIISISVAGILWRWFFNSEFGLFNAYLSHIGVKIPWLTDKTWAMNSVVLMTFWWTLGGPMVILLAGLQQIPKQYHEAASIDGAGTFQRFLHITLPLLRPILLFVVIISIIATFQIFGQTFMITHGGPALSTRVLVQYIYEIAFTNYRLGYGAAVSWLLFIIIAIFSFTQFKLLRESK